MMPSYKSLLDDDETVPVVFSVNEAYFPYMVVALQSISETLHIGKRCVAYVMHLGLPEASILWLERENRWPNINFSFINVSSKLDLTTLPTRAHYSNDIYLRLWIPEIFCDLKKIIYLDADIVVRESLHHLYEVDISKFDVGGVRDISNAQHYRYVKNDLRLSADYYINSGVILFNIQSCLRNKFRQKCLNSLDNHLFLNCPDQDMINIACRDRIKILDPGWNYLWNYGFSKHRKPPDGPAWFFDDFVESARTKKIIHFSSAIKPWNEPRLEDAEFFWQTAQRSCSYQKILHAACANRVSALLKMIREQRQPFRT